MIKSYESREGVWENQKHNLKRSSNGRNIYSSSIRVMSQKLSLHEQLSPITKPARLMRGDGVTSFRFLVHFIS